MTRIASALIHAVAGALRFRVRVAVGAALLAGAPAHATGAIGCESADGHTRVELQVSLTQEAAGDGIAGLRLARRGQADRIDWTLTAARADYRAHHVRLSAQPVRGAGHTATPPLRLRIDGTRGHLRLGPQRTRLTCDWGEFS